MAEESAVAASSSSPANSGAFFRISGSTPYLLPDHGTALDGKATVECRGTHTSEPALRGSVAGAVAQSGMVSSTTVNGMSSNRSVGGVGLASDAPAQAPIQPFDKSHT